jgi:CheY-like chemotaxis protein
MLLPAATRSAFQGLASVPLGASSLESIRQLPSSKQPVSRKQLQFGGSVLVVEDNAINRRIICSLLSNMGIAFDTAENGYEGFEKCRNGRYDLVLMDCQMPVMDGYEATRNIRSLAPGGDKVTIVGTSASTDADTGRICRAAGMDDYLPKPISRSSLEGLLESLNKYSCVEMKA